MLGGDDGRTLYVVANRYSDAGGSDGVVLVQPVDVAHAGRPLKRWNDWGARLFNGRVLEPDDVQVTRRKAMQLDLPRQARDELGGAWEALYQDAGAWTWVRSRQP